MREENLIQKMAQGKRPVVAYYHPAATVKMEVIEAAAESLKVADAVILADNPGAIVHMHPLAAALPFLQRDVDVILELEGRDKNRLAIQSEILGAVALGIHNFLCLLGEHQTQGTQPEAKGVYDLSATHLIEVVKSIERGELLDGFRLADVPSLMAGGMVNPFARPFELHFFKILKKIKVGADFLITTPIFVIDEFKEFIQEMKSRNLLKKTKIIGTVMPIKSAEIAKIVAKKPTVYLPQSLLSRWEGVSDAQQAEVGIEVCLEILEALKDIEEVAGFHIMAPHWPEAVGIIRERAQL